MGRRFDFGVIGGYGATGKSVATELQKRAGATLLIGGHDFEKSQAVARQFDARVSAALVDVLDPCSLDSFCSQCSVIINCAGPVSQLQDRVAQSALRNRCHYVDPAGLTIVEDRLRPHAQAIADAGLCFVISAGWMPGLTELLPVYAHARAKATMDSVASVTVYFADRGDWSRSALLDGVWFLRRRGIHGPAYFSLGKRVRATSTHAMRTVDLGPTMASGRFGLYWTPEMEWVGRCLADCDVYSYSYVSGVRTIAASLVLAAMPLPVDVGVHMLRHIFQRNRFPVGGFAAVEVRGTAEGGPASAATSITFDRGRDYWFHGVALATVAGLVAEREHVKPGVHFLADAVDPEALLARLGGAQIKLAERFTGAR